MQTGRKTACKYGRIFFFPLSICWMECILRIFSLKMFAGRGLGYTLLFSLPAGLLCALLSSLWGQTGNRRAAIALLSAATGWYMVQTVYYRVFKTFLMLDTLTMAGDDWKAFGRKPSLPSETLFLYCFCWQSR